MISLEAYRSAVGCWNGRRAYHKPFKEKFVHNSDLQWSERDRMIEAQVIMLYKRLFLLLLGAVVMPLLLLYTTQTLFANRPVSHPNKDYVREEFVRMSKQLIQTLLVMAGIEKNPGPTPTHQSQGKVPRKRYSAVCPYPDCGKTITRKENMKKHIERWHVQQHNIVCRFCEKPFENFEDWRRHMDEHKPRTDRWKKTASAFNDRVIELTHLYHELSIEKALSEAMMKSVIRQVSFYRRAFGAVRFQLNFVCLMEKSVADETRNEQFYFQGTKGRDLLRGEHEVKKSVQEEFVKLRERVLDLDVQAEGSGWSFVCSEAMMIQITKHASNKMGSYIPFRPKNIRGNVKRNVFNNMINVKNEDDKCVIWNIILSVFGHKIRKDKTNPKYLEKYLKYVNDENVEYPITEKDLQILEENNKELNISINVWKYISSTHIEPYYISRVSRKGMIKCDMMLIQSKQTKDEVTKQHLIHIKDIRGLFRGVSISNKQDAKHFYCPSCQHFKTQSSQKMIQHHKQCQDPNYFKKILPPSTNAFLPDGNVMRPPNSYRAERPILRGFFDFETLQKVKIPEQCEECYKTLTNLGCQTGSIDIACKHKKQSQTITITELPAICFSLIILSNQGEKVFEECYLGLDAAQVFSRLLLSMENHLMQYIEMYCELQMTEEDQRLFDLARSCEDCGVSFSEEGVKKCRDHNHSTGCYRAALCGFCNLQKKRKMFIPIYAHNFTGFDANLVVQALNADRKKFSTLSRNTEKIITMTIGRFKLIDSSSFMPESLEVLAANLKTKGDKLFQFTKNWLKGSRKKLNLLTSKGVYPYEYLTDFNKVFEKELPAKEEFYSNLKEAHISDSDYMKAHEVWKEFDCNTIGSYTKLYCLSDVHLLADVWENFCNETSKHLYIHPEAGYISLPSYAFDVVKHKMKAEQNEHLQVLSEAQKKFHEDITTGIRGGSCMLKQKAAFDTAMKTYLLEHADEIELAEYEKIKILYREKARKRTLDILRKAKKKTLAIRTCQVDDCQELILAPNKRCSQHELWTIIALDFNNLYGDSMRNKLPLDTFEDLSQKEIEAHQDKFDTIKRTQTSAIIYPEDSEQGFIFCARLKFSEKVQKKLLSYPIVPESLVIESEMLSQGQLETWRRLFGKDYSNSHKKMVACFLTKEAYTSHYQTLAFFSVLGVEVTLLRGYKFRQTNFLSSYVKMCADQRKKATNPADKNIHKLMANIIFGKVSVLLLCSTK